MAVNYQQYVHTSACWRMVAWSMVNSVGTLCTRYRLPMGISVKPLPSTFSLRIAATTSSLTSPRNSDSYRTVSIWCYVCAINFISIIVSSISQLCTIVRILPTGNIPGRLAGDESQLEWCLQSGRWLESVEKARHPILQQEWKDLTK